MAIEKRTYLYEFLIRFGRDGFQGAHQIRMEEVYETESGDIIAARPLPAEPVENEDISALIGEGNAELLSAVEKLSIDLANAKNTIASLSEENSLLHTDILRLKEKLLPEGRNDISLAGTGDLA